MRKLVFLIAAVAAAASLADYLAWRSSHRGLSALAEETGLFGPLPELEVQLRRETVSARAATLVGWGLLDLEIDRRWLDDLPPNERAMQAASGVDRLRRARRLAEETLPRRPASWQAAMTLGVTRYLEAERTGERTQPIVAWRQPLLAAMQLAPGLPEPPLFLASASLSRWSSLSSAERDETVPVLTRALEEPAGLDLLIRPWVRLAPSMARLLEVMPDRPRAWQRLGQVFLQADDLERFGSAHQRWLDSLPAYLAAQVDQAEARVRGGDAALALDFARRVFEAPPDLAHAESFSRALALVPPDYANARTGRELRRWLLWALDLCRIGDCPLDAEAINRLTGLVDDLQPASHGVAALVVGDADGAAELERQAGDAQDAEWQRYWVFKATRLATVEPEAALAAIEKAGTGLDDPLYWHAREWAAEHTGDQQDLGLARAELDRLGRGPWSTSDWFFRSPTHRLSLLTVEPRERLRLELAGMPAEGAAIELHWDGRILGVVALQPGEELIWPVPVEPGIHQVGITNLSGRPLRPGTLSLESARPAG